MDQLNNYADDRLINGCIYCGGLEQTREHVPSKVLLSKPFPNNLPVMKACFECNNGYSEDEAYVACLIASVFSGSADPDKIENARAAKILRSNSSLRNKISAALNETEGHLIVEIEQSRLLNVIRKLAIGHAAFELSIVLRHEPTWTNWFFIQDLSEEQKGKYNAPHFPELLGEIGSRNLQRECVTELTLQNSEGKLEKHALITNDWVEVQESIYRYHTIHEGSGVLVKITFSEFIGAEIFWEDEVG